MNEDKPNPEKTEEAQPKPAKIIDKELSAEMDQLLSIPTVLDDSELTTEVNPPVVKKDLKPVAAEPIPENTAKTEKPEKTKRPLKKYILPVILGVVLLITAIISILTVIFLNTNTKPVFARNTPAEEAAKACITEKVAFDELTKEDAYEWLNILYHDKNCAVENLLNDDDDFILDDNMNDGIHILYSYSDTSDIQKIANADLFLNPNQEDVTFDILEKEHFAIVRDNSRESCKNDSCYIGVIFDKNYANYYGEIKQSGDISYYENHFSITNFDKDWIKTVLDIFNSESFLQGVYDSSIEFDGTNYIYTTHNLGVGIDLTATADQTLAPHQAPQAINLYETKTIIDPSGAITKVPLTESGDFMNVVKAFSLTDEEAATLTIDDGTER